MVYIYIYIYIEEERGIYKYLCVFEYYKSFIQVIYLGVERMEGPLGGGD